MRQERLTSNHTSTNHSLSSEAGLTACFSIQAEADPGVMPRILELFAKRGLIPNRWHSNLEGAATHQPALTIDLQVNGLNRQQVEHVSNSLRGLVSVNSVLTCEKQYA